MKTKLLYSLVTIIAVGGLLSACGFGEIDEKSSVLGVRSTENRFTEKVYEYVGLSKIGITTDKETGCKYVIYENEGASPGSFTPLLAADGTPDCGK